LVAKPITLKIENLLAQYLYQHKKLGLPGLGQFTLSDAAILPDENSKSKSTLEGISFNNKTPGQPEDTLIEFIKKETGKMKALAQADLDSYIMLAQQFLNIGKPFYLEGIGTLHKKRDGSIDFNAGTAVPLTPVKHEEKEESKRKSAFSEEKTAGSSAGMRGLVMALGIIGTIAVIAGGGYYLYSKNTDADVAVTTSLQSVTDSQLTRNITPDTTALVANPAMAATTPVDGYKFILETTDKKVRALKRYDMIKTARVLKSYGSSRIQLETKDSTNFNIYIVLNCPPQDTLRYKDSLNAWYYGLKPMKVKIE
jgi:hypothetical protein